MLVTLGTCQYYNGDDLAATMTLQRVHRLDPNHLKGMDILAALYAKEKKVGNYVIAIPFPHPQHCLKGPATH
jgi:hypothetical protein